MDATTILYILAYAAATLLYLGHHIGAGERMSQVARGTLAAAWAVQLLDIGVRCFRLQHPLSSVAEAMAFSAFLITGAFLAASFRYRIQAGGAIAASGGLALLVLARVGPGAVGHLSGPLGITHVFLATVGLATFAFAAIVAALYLLQERRLKRRRFDRMKEPSAPLDTLDRLSARSVSFGFPVFTLTILTGALWVARLGGLPTLKSVRPEYVLSLVSWLAFAVLLLARLSAGWQGRRAAWLTLGGFSSAALVLLGYFLRAA